ncbi:MAG TPA: hypothetical protein VEW74_09885 [Candidatus Nitrosotalea sp.]|nr:hypothetical protein [Candidatus Nitrosotalea sp.]
MPGFLAALWLLGLFAAAPALRTSERYELADRLRDALVLGVAIPFALGLVHAFYPLACWLVLVATICIAETRRILGAAILSQTQSAPVPFLFAGALVAVAWPQLMRPLLDGDTLSYHLPNAASWVQAHSLWTTATRYWWYPPASELFASGVYAVSGPFALPWSGFFALALLGLRVAAWARSINGTSPLLADALAAATITAYPLAIQGGTLQNDVWLAAFWLESLWALRARTKGAAAMRTLAVTTLTKPDGWIFAALAMFVRRAPRRVWLAAGSALALWILRDALLYKSAALSPAGAMPPNLFDSTIVAHGVAAFALLARVALAASPFALIALLAALFGPLIAPRDRRLGWAACAAALLFFVMPFGYETAVAQLATGASLRFAAPAIAAGAIILAYPAQRASVIATALLALSTLFGAWCVLAIFWNDGGTHVAIVFALLTVALAALVRLRALWPCAIALCLAVIATTHLASRHPLDYYNDSLRVGNVSPGIYRWIATQRPPAIGGWGLRLGVVNVLSPPTRTLDLSDAQPCAQARRESVLMVAVAQNDLAPDVNRTRLQRTRACGPALYEDPIAIVAQPP